MKRILLSLFLLSALSATADARLHWRSPRAVASQRLVIQRSYTVPGQPARNVIRRGVQAPANVIRCLGGTCHR